MSNNNTAMHTLGYEGKSGIFSGKDRIRTKRTKKKKETGGKCTKHNFLNIFLTSHAKKD